MTLCGRVKLHTVVLTFEEIHCLRCHLGYQYATCQNDLCQIFYDMAHIEEVIIDSVLLWEFNCTDHFSCVTVTQSELQNLYTWYHKFIKNKMSIHNSSY